MFPFVTSVFDTPDEKEFHGIDDDARRVVRKWSVDVSLVWRDTYVAVRTNVDDAMLHPVSWADRGLVGRALMVFGHQVVSWLLSPRYVCRISYLRCSGVVSRGVLSKPVHERWRLLVIGLAPSDNNALWSVIFLNEPHTFSFFSITLFVVFLLLTLIRSEWRRNHPFLATRVVLA